MGAHYMFVRVKGCHTSFQDGKQFILVVIDAQKLRPVSRNATVWPNASTSSHLSLAACFTFQTFREIFIPHDIHSADMLQL